MNNILKVGIGLVCFTAMSGWGLTASYAQQKQSGKLTKPELNFMHQAAAINVWYVQAGKLGEKRARNPVVKKYAEQLINEHSEANNRLLAIAKMKGIHLPSQMNQQHKNLIKKLQQAKNFDLEYMQAMVADHKHVLYEMQKDQPNITDPNLKAWLHKMIPLLRVETASAEELLQKVRFKQKYLEHD